MNSPTVTIGMPVFNGEDYLADAITSLLDQTYRDFALVIYDNASTDRTAFIAESCCRRDSRVTLVRHPRTVSAADNFVVAAERADTPFFCWAAHDDLRDRMFLHSLVNLLATNPRAGLAACGCVELDPDGSQRRICQATLSLQHAVCSSRLERLVAYLRQSPCSPIYGLFRTDHLKRHLTLLRRAPQFGGDLAFLAGFLAQHELAFTHSPLLMLRGGGASHNPDQFRNLAHLFRELRNLHCGLKRSIGRLESPVDRALLLLARWRLLLRYLLCRPVRMIMAHHIRRQVPMLGRLRDQVYSRIGVFGRLRHRAEKLPRGTRVIVFGAGKHTRRTINVLRISLGRNASLVAICDDKAHQIRPFTTCELIISPNDLSSHMPDLIIVSSDTYERQLVQRALTVGGTAVPVWCLYDVALESRVLKDKGEEAPRMWDQCTIDHQRSAAA